MKYFHFFQFIILIIFTSTASGVEKLPSEHQFTNTNVGGFETYNKTTNDLSNNVVTGIVEDIFGRLIVSTERGLNYFDGFNFFLLHLEAEGYNSDNLIYKQILQDDNNIIWLGTTQGLFSYNPVNEIFELRHRQAKIDSKVGKFQKLNHNYIKSLAFDPEGGLYFNYHTDNIYYNLNIETGKIEKYYIGNNEGFSKAKLKIIKYVSNDEMIYISKNNFLFKYDIVENTCKNYFIEEALSKRKIRNIYLASDSNLWLTTTDKSIIRYNTSDRSYKEFSFNDLSFLQIYNSIIEDKYGIIYFCSTKGLYRYNKDESWLHYNSESKHGISENYLRILYNDSSNILWIGSNEGLIKKNPKVNISSMKILTSGRLKSNKVNSIRPTKLNHYWVCTLYAGLQYFDPQKISINFVKIPSKYKNIFRSDHAVDIVEFNDQYFVLFANNGLYRLTTHDNINYSVNPIDLSKYVNNNQIYDNIFLDNQGNLWISIRNTDFFLKYHINSTQCEKIVYNNIYANKWDYYIKYFYIDSKGNNWLGTRNGIYKYDTNGIFTYIENINKNTRNTITNILEDHEGNILYSSNQEGISKINTNTNELTNIVPSKNFIFDFIINSDNSEIWYTKVHKGLCRWDMKEKKETVINSLHGLSGNNYFKITFIDSNSLLIFGDKGMSSFNFKTKDIVNYSSDMGFRFDLNIRNSIRIKKNGTIYAGGKGSIFTILADEIQHEPSKELVLFTNLFVNNKNIKLSDTNTDGEKYYKNGLNSKPNVNLTYDDKIITFDYFYPEYINSEAIKYAIKLSGLDKDWQYVNRNTSATYAFLPPGEYDFIVKAVSSTGKWTNEESKIHITVHPAFWQTSIFKISGILLILLFITLFYFYRTKRIKIKNELLENHNIKLQQEISKRIVIENEIRKLSIAVEQSLESILITDTKGNIEYVNPAFEKTSGLKNDMIIKRNILVILMKNNEELLYNFLNIDKANYEFNFFAEDEKEYKFVRTVSPINSEQGDLDKFVFILHDVTEIDKMSKELEHSRKIRAIGTMASGIAHDLNNIIASIRLNADLISESEKLDSEIEIDLKELISGTDKAKDIVGQILDFSRKEDEHFMSVNLAELIEANMRVLKSVLGEKMDLSLSLEDTLYIKGDKTSIFQIMMNVISNAVDAMDDDGSIHIKAFKKLINKNNCFEYTGLDDGSYVVLKITDTGKGINKNDLEQIFDPFFTTKSVGKGTGMGLSIIRTIVDSMNGKIYVDSQLGKGSSFTFVFPAI